MSNEHENRPSDPDALTQVQQTLASFAPQATAVDRDRLMFLAGMASAEKSGVTGLANVRLLDGRHWLWPAATTGLAATSLALLAAFLVRREPEPQIVYRDREVFVSAKRENDGRATPAVDANSIPVRLAARTETSVSVVPANNYIRSREVALLMGLDAIGSPHATDSAAPSSATYRDWLLEMSGAAHSESGAPATSQSPNM